MTIRDCQSSLHSFRHLSAVIVAGILFFAHGGAAQIQFTQQGSELARGDVAGAAQQGTSVAISADGNTAIVGGPSDNCKGAGCVGAAWIYTRSGGVWSQLDTKLVGAGAVGGAYQGTSVAISGDGNTAVVGGPGDDSNAGAVWVFIRSGEVWRQQGEKLVGSGAIGEPQLGFSVAISADGNTVIAGGPHDNPAAASNFVEFGAAWVFVRSGGTWSQQGNKLVGSDNSGPGWQGYSVAISADGNTALVGGPWDGYLGAAWVYTRNAGVWSQQAKLFDSKTAHAGLQGWSVAISSDGNTAILGAPEDGCSEGGGCAGGAWIYTRSANVWSQQGDKLTGSGVVSPTFQGWSVAVSGDGNAALVGGVGDGSQTGDTWVFARSNGAWSQQGTALAGTGTTGAAWQGYSVAISGDAKTAIIGGPADDYSAGGAWIFATTAGASIVSGIETSTVDGDAEPPIVQEQGNDEIEYEQATAAVGPEPIRSVSSQTLSPPPQQFVLDFGVQSASGPLATLSEPVSRALDPGSSFTVEFWIYLETASPNQKLFGRWLDQDADFLYLLNFDSSGTAITFDQNSATGGRGGTSAAVIPVRTWTHIAAILNGSTLSLLVNGAVVSSVTSPGPPATPASSAYEFGPGSLVAFRQVRIWSRALTPAEIATNAGQYVDGNSRGLIAYWPMDDGPGARVRDLGPVHADIQLRPDYTTDPGSPRWIHASVLESGPYFTFEPNAAPDPLAVAGFIDFNNDGFLDVLGVQPVEGPVFAFVNDGHGHFSDATSNVFGGPGPTVVDHVRYVPVADFNGDGLMDCFITGTDEGAHPDTGGQSRILMQKPGGHLADETATRLPIQPGSTHSVTLGDIDGNGTVDIFMGNIRNAVTLGPVFYINDGTGHFTQDATRTPPIVPNGAYPITSSRLVDVRNSGHPDLFLGRFGAIQPHDGLLLNDGTGHFAFVPDAALPLRCGGPDFATVDVATADFDGDGWPDVLLAQYGNNYTATCLQLLLNNRNGTFRDATNRIPPQNWPAAGYLHEVEAVDLNGDGWIDFIAHGNGTAESRIYLNMGEGYFVDATDLLPMKGPFFTIVAGDVDNDGKKDLLVSTGNTGINNDFYVLRQLKAFNVDLLREPRRRPIRRH